MRDLKWSDSEKKIARLRVLSGRLHQTRAAMSRFKERAASASTPQ
jgi:hypothetical protein